MSVYFTQEKIKIINVNQDLFASLSKIQTSLDETKQTYTFDLNFDVNLDLARRKNTLTVRTTLYSKLLTITQSMVKVTAGKLDAQTVINAIKKQSPNTKNANTEQEKYIILSNKTDLTSYMDNSTILKNVDKPVKRNGLGATRAKTSSPPSQTIVKKKLVVKQVDDIKNNADNQPNFNQMIRDITVIDTPDSPGFGSSLIIKSLMHDMIVYSGLDPSTVSGLNHISTTPKLSTGGLLNKIRSDAPNFVSKEQQKLFDQVIQQNVQQIPETIDDITNTNSVVVLDNVDTNIVTVSNTVTFESTKLYVNGTRTNSIIVRFEALEADTGVVVSSVDARLDLTKHITNYQTPITPPWLRVSSGGSETTLEISQRDTVAKSVRLFRKVLNRTTPDIPDYSLVGEYPLSNVQKHMTIPVPTPLNSYHIYRAIAVGQNKNLGHDYSNAIVRPKKVYPYHATSLVALLDKQGVQLQLRHIPSDVVSVQFIARTYQNKSAWYDVSDVVLITDEIRTSDVYTLIDENVKNNWVYEYAIKLFYFNGNTEQTAYSTITFLQSEEGKVDTKIGGLNVDDTSINVSFNITTNINDTLLDQIKIMLDKQGLTQYYNDNLLTSREQFKKLIAHKIDRVDLTLGVRETYNVIIDGLFDDATLSTKNAVKPLQQGHQYRYEIFTLLRTPETMLSDLVKTSIDELTKKEYSFSPVTFQHPLVLKNGTLVSNSSLKLNHPEEEMTHGIVGSVESITVNFSANNIQLNNVSVFRLNLDTVWLSWDVSGNIRNIDHFLVMKDVLGARTFVGKAHLESEKASVRFIHNINENDMGQYRYYVVPVFNDYDIGDGVFSTSIVIN